MKVAIGCSMKHRELVNETISALNAIGIVPLFPNLDDGSSENEGIAMEEKKRLALEHYEAIDSTDVVYLLTPGGYMGTSCKLELGYAIAKNKLIYFSEPTNDPALDCYVKEFISTNDLKKFLLI